MSEANKDFVAHTHVVIAVCVVPPCASKDYPSASFDRRVFLCPHTRRDRRVCRPAVCVVPGLSSGHWRCLLRGLLTGWHTSCHRVLVVLVHSCTYLYHPRGIIFGGRTAHRAGKTHTAGQHTRRDNTHGGTTHTAITTCVWAKEDTAVKGS